MKYNKIKSHAKINLVLNVIGKTSSLHKIESIIAFIDLHDVIMIKRTNSSNHSISFNGKFSKNISENNTVSNLLKILDKKNLLYNKKYKIRINKKIPTKAGLGGGSMNAASILRYFVKKKIIKIRKKKIIEISRLIGSDVIYGLNPTHSITTYKNRIKFFKKNKKFYILIVKPNFGCSTKDIYAKVKKFDKPQIINPVKSMFDLNHLKKMNNSLEKIALSKYPSLKSIKLYLEGLSDQVFVRMTGSGSALVVYFQTKERCLNAKKLFSKKYKNYWCKVSKTI